MQRELYKLVLVFIMILLAFSVAFFLGREMAFLEGQGGQKTPGPQGQNQPLPPPASLNPPPEAKPPPTHREAVRDYQKILKNQPDPPVEKKAQKPPPVYALLVKGYKTMEEAMEESTRLKVKFPNFKIFFHLSEGYYKVYIGPFGEEKTALNFLSEVQKKEKQLQSLKLEKVPGGPGPVKSSGP